MSEPLEYRAPSKPPSQASLILGVLSIVCAPSTFVFLASFADRVNDNLVFKVVWLIPMTGSFMGVSGIAYRKSSPPKAAWIGMILNLLILGLFLLGRTGALEVGQN